MRNLIVILLLFVSCNPVKQVLKNVHHKETITTILKSQGICTPDTLTFYKTDTIVKVDTVGVIEIFTDTVRINDTIKISITKYRDIIRTLSIKDTIKSVVIDADAVKSLSQINTKLVTENELLKVQKRNYQYISLALFGFILLFIALMIKK